MRLLDLMPVAGEDAAANRLGFTRMSIPYLLGTMLTPGHDRALVPGTDMHLVAGWVFAFLYAGGFELLQRATWWLGGFGGLLHGLFVLVVVMRILPGIHPRMVSEYFGPTTNRQIQPPGTLALNYGRRTPMVRVLAHLTYGIVLGASTRPSDGAAALTVRRRASYLDRGSFVRVPEEWHRHSRGRSRPRPWTGTTS